jgi:hypothetical protein
MDWDDEDEATHVFDKAEDSKAERPPTNPSASMRAGNNGIGKGTMVGMGAPVPPPPNPSQPPFRSSSPSFRPAPPPPNTTMGMRTSSLPPPPNSGFARASGIPAAAPGPSFPTNDVPGTAPIPMPAAQTNHQVHTAPMPMPSRIPSVPPPSMEATALVRPRGEKRVGLMVVAGVGAIVTLALGYMLLSAPKTGRIVINVTDAKGGVVNHLEVFIDGKKWCDTAPCYVDKVEAGMHEVKVLADGYEVPAERGLAVEARKDASVNFTLTSSSQKAGTGIRVNGNQPGVKLYVDGQDYGTLPQDLRTLSPGDHRVRLVGSDRYEPIEKNVIVAANEMQDLGSMTLNVLKGKATISLSTPGAKVYIVSGSDRRELPTLPISVDIDTSKGTWSLEAMKPGFNDYRQAISFDDGQAEKTFAISLDPKSSGSGSTNSSSQSAASQAATPAPASTPKSTPTPQAVAAAEAPTAAAATGEAFLNINSIPASSVVLDGKPIGNTPKLRISVTPGAHTVTFINSDQGLKKQVSVTVGAGETKVAMARLRD